MAGYGAPAWAVNGFTDTVQVTDGPTPNDPDSITMVGCLRDSPAILSAEATQGSTQLTLQAGQAGVFDTGVRSNIFVGGVENAVITGIAGDVLTIDTDAATAGNQGLQNSHLANAVVNLVRAVTYTVDNTNPNDPRLTRDDNTGGVPPVFAENILNIQINPITPDQSAYTVTLTAITDRQDRDYVDLDPNSDPNYRNFRKKTMSANIKIRNLSIQNQGF